MKSSGLALLLVPVELPEMKKGGEVAAGGRQ